MECVGLEAHGADTPAWCSTILIFGAIHLVMQRVELADGRVTDARTDVTAQNDGHLVGDRFYSSNLEMEHEIMNLQGLTS